MSITVFIQEHSGDYNEDTDWADRIEATRYVDEVRKEGGYWLEDGHKETFIPMHRIDRIEIRSKG